MIRRASGAIVFPRGFRAGAVHAGLKKNPEAPDLTIIASLVQASCAGCFTTNRVSAAPVKWSRAVSQKGFARAIVANAGAANACTGKEGYRHARRMAEATARALGMSVGEGVLVASTGMIGVMLPIEKIEEGIRQAAKILSRSPLMGHRASLAILTTDLVTKEARATLKLGKSTVRLGAMAKGSGMIAPKLATMLAFITTDALISPEMLRLALNMAVNGSFNALTVDGHTSTNDTVVILANGLAGNPRIEHTAGGFPDFSRALKELCVHLAKEIARDGEGATKLIEVRVSGAPTFSLAEKVAFAIATSPLVKTAVFGEDPNWGRIVSAAGFSCQEVREEKMSLALNGVRVFRRGLAVEGEARNRARLAMRSKKLLMHLDLGLGHFTRVVWTCDFSYDYVRINSAYST